jgi:RNA polymerase sigma factor (sigma-70 family)
MKKSNAILGDVNSTNELAMWKNLRRLILHKAIGFFKGIEAITAEDATQDALEKIVSKQAMYSGEKASFSTWAMRVANNHFIDLKRKYKNEKGTLSFSDVLHNQSEEVYDTFPDLLLAMIHLLPKLDAELLKLKYFELKSGREIAQMLAIKEQYIPVYMKRAKERLATIVKRQADLAPDAIYEPMSTFGLAA